MPSTPTFPPGVLRCIGSPDNSQHDTWLQFFPLHPSSTVFGFFALLNCTFLMVRVRTMVLGQILKHANQVPPQAPVSSGTHLKGLWWGLKENNTYEGLRLGDSENKFRYYWCYGIKHSYKSMVWLNVFLKVHSSLFCHPFLSMDLT